MRDGEQCLLCWLLFWSNGSLTVLVVAAAVSCFVLWIGQQFAGAHTLANKSVDATCGTESSSVNSDRQGIHCTAQQLSLTWLCGACHHAAILEPCARRNDLVTAGSLRPGKDELLSTRVTGSAGYAPFRP